MKDLEIRIPGPAVWAAVFVLVEVACVVLYHFSDEHYRPTIVFSATVVGGGFAALTYSLGVLERRRVCAARFMERFVEEPMSDSRAAVREFLEDKQEINSIMRTAGQSMNQEVIEKRLHLVRFLNFLEEMAIAIFSRQADEKTLKDYFPGVLRASYPTFKNWIERERVLDSEPDEYIQLERLYGRWTQKRK
jgi:hypothetical protein